MLFRFLISYSRGPHMYATHRVVRGALRQVARVQRYASYRITDREWICYEIFPRGGYEPALPFAERSVAASRRWGDYGADIAGSSHTLLHSESAVRRSRDRIGRSITILMVAIPLYCKSLEFQFETKLCIFQNISKYFIEKIPHVLQNMQQDENQVDIAKMLNICGEPADGITGEVSCLGAACCGCNFETQLL